MSFHFRPDICAACAFHVAYEDQHLPDDKAFAFVVGLAHSREAREKGISLCHTHMVDMRKVTDAFADAGDAGPLAPEVMEMKGNA